MMITFALTKKPVFFFRIISVVIAGFLLASCSPEDTPGPDNGSEDVDEPEIKVEMTSITVSPSEKELNVGESFKLTATVAPDNAIDKTVYWRSSRSSTATVASDGTVTAVKAGTAVITAYHLTSNGEVKGTCALTVVQKINSIELNRKEVHLNVGNKLYLTALVSPEDAPSAKSLVSASSNENVATVDQSGAVTALAAGSADISASADGKTGVCHVIVDPVQGGNEGTGEENWK